MLKKVSWIWQGLEKQCDCSAVCIRKRWCLAWVRWCGRSPGSELGLRRWRVWGKGLDGGWEHLCGLWDLGVIPSSLLSQGLKLAYFVLLLSTSSGFCEMKKLGVSSNQYVFDLRPIDQVVAHRDLNLFWKMFMAWPGWFCHLRVC